MKDSTYVVFVRDWWRRATEEDRGYSLGSKIPYPGAPKRRIGRAGTEAEAQAMCKEYNSTHNPGWRSRKAEYTDSRNY